MSRLLGLDPATYTPHPLHDADRAYSETNCYTDVVIELLHACGHEPTAALGGAVTVDFELDQWTFFKPAAEDLRLLYGVEVHEMQPYLGLAEQIARRLGVGQTLMPEVDAIWLPDTTTYRQEHVKTSIVAEAIDPEARVLRYFHNAGFFELSGDDYDGVFGALTLPTYVDLIRFDAGAPAADPRATALALFEQHLARRPQDNPFDRFAAQLRDDLVWLAEAPIETYHAYAFANARMAGASFELLAAHVRWLFGADGEPAAAALDEVVGASKVLLFRLARRRAFDVAGAVVPMRDGWATAMDSLDALVRR